MAVDTGTVAAGATRRLASVEGPRCRCGHAADAHEHYRPGSDCGACGAAGCARFRAARGAGGGTGTPPVVPAQRSRTRTQP